MNNRLLINYSPGSTALHRLNGLTKVLMFVVLTVSIIATFDVRVMLPILFACLAGIVSMKPRWKPVVFVICFMTVMAGVIGSLMIILIAPDSAERYVGGSTLLWQVGKIKITRELLWYLGAMYTKRLTSLMSSLVFILSITPSELAAGLAGIGLPYRICTIVSVALRTIPDIARDYADIRSAMMLRGAELDPRRSSLAARLKGSVVILVPLIITSFARVETIANAMDLRGYGKMRRRTWYSENPPARADWAARGLLALLSAFTVWYIVWFRFLHPYPFTYWSPWIAG